MKDSNSDNNLIAMGIGLLVTTAVISIYMTIRQIYDDYNANERKKIVDRVRQRASKSMLDIDAQNDTAKANGMEIPPSAEVKTFSEDEVHEAEETRNKVSFSQKFLVPTSDEAIRKFGFQQIAAMKVCDKPDGSEDRLAMSIEAKPEIINFVNGCADGFEVYDEPTDALKRIMELNESYTRSIKDNAPKDTDEAIKRMLDIIHDVDKG